MALGDHLKVRRLVMTYAHHGIDLGDGTVVHFKEPDDAEGARIVRTGMDEFLRGDRARLVRHRRPFPPEEICARALSRVGETGYNLAYNNCEHFANWCATGKNKSTQVLRAVGTVAAMVGIAVIVVIGRGRRA